MSKRKGRMQQESQAVVDNKKSIEHTEARREEDVVKDVEAGDVKSLRELLEHEHRKRMPDAHVSPISEENTARFLQQPGMEKDLLEDIMKIASDNNLTPDWVLIRALKVYVREYQRTGRL
jgi:hypothetical protein